MLEKDTHLGTFSPLGSDEKGCLDLSSSPLYFLAQGNNTWHAVCDSQFWVLIVWALIITNPGMVFYTDVSNIYNQLPLNNKG